MFQYLKGDSVPPHLQFQKEYQFHNSLLLFSGVFVLKVPSSYSRSSVLGPSRCPRIRPRTPACQPFSLHVLGFLVLSISKFFRNLYSQNFPLYALKSKIKLHCREIFYFSIIASFIFSLITFFLYKSKGGKQISITIRSLSLIQSLCNIQH